MVHVALVDSGVGERGEGRHAVSASSLLFAQAVSTRSEIRPENARGTASDCLSISTSPVRHEGSTSRSCTVGCASRDFRSRRILVVTNLRRSCLTAVSELHIRARRRQGRLGVLGGQWRPWCPALGHHGPAGASRGAQRGCAAHRSWRLTGRRAPGRFPWLELGRLLEKIFSKCRKKRPLTEV